MPIGKVGEKPHMISFKYERLPIFCFYCACLGHAERLCAKLLDHPEPENVVRPYSVSLRALPRRQQPVPKSKYLVPLTPPVQPVNPNSDQGASSVEEVRMRYGIKGEEYGLADF
ncbi:hypothetical protein M5689_009555 [Euphorbia peplus]|nr:hypothetical protein M5689_009555 [Euphorbia peplus]